MATPPFRPSALVEFPIRTEIAVGFRGLRPKFCLGGGGYIPIALSSSTCILLSEVTESTDIESEQAQQYIQQIFVESKMYGVYILLSIHVLTPTI